MQRALTLALVLASGGCYCSHERIAPPDAPESDVGPDLRCTAVCEPAERLGAIAHPAAESLVSIAIEGDRLAILGVRRGDEHEGLVYVVTTFDLAAGGAVGTDSTREVWTAFALGRGAVDLEGGAARIFALTTDVIAGRFPARASVSTASFTTASALETETVGVAELPFTYEPCGCALPTATPWRGPHAAVVALQGETLWLTRVDLDATPVTTEALELAHFASAPPRATPISADLWPDGRLVAVAGGYGSGLEPRDAVFVAETSAGEVAVAPLPGERFDPPPSVGAVGDDAAVFRFVSDPRDLEESGLRAEIRDEHGELVDGAPIRTVAGLVPLAAATFVRDDGAGLVWVEPDDWVRILPPAGSGSASTWSECPGFGETAVMRLDETLQIATRGGTSLLASALPGTHDVIVVALTSSREPGGDVAPRLEILRVPSCRLDRAS